jgi:sec-independent protein translocase protein TatB
MFDISWTEFLLIGIVALIVIGPKELPGVMRTMGQWTRKVRGMAAEFQGQFQEAMREAEMADLKKQVDDMAHDLTSIDPLKSVREDVEGVGKEIEKSLADEPKGIEPEAAPSADEVATQIAGPSAEDSTTPRAEAAAMPAPGEPLELKPEAAAVADEASPPPAALPEPQPEPATAAVEPENAERTG